VVALSPDRPQKLLESRKAKSIGYALYSDSGLDAARAFGIAFQLDAETRQEYEGYGIDLTDASGEGHGQLPVPSVFLVAPGGEIRWVYSNPDYTTRPDNEQIVAAARKAAPQSP
jgi:peroxiredoxin